MLTCSICCETNGVELICVDIGRGRIQKIPYCTRHAAYLRPMSQNETSNDDLIAYCCGRPVIAYCCGRPVNPESGRCSRCGDRYD